MSQIVLGRLLVLLVLALQIVLICRRITIDLSPINQAYQAVEKAFERTERAVREEIAKNREELAIAARQTREELANTLKGVGDSLNTQLATLTQASDQKLGSMRETVEQRLGALQEGNTKKLDEIRQEAAASSQKTGEEAGKAITDFLQGQREQFVSLIEQLTKLTASNEKRLDAVRTAGISVSPSIAFSISMGTRPIYGRKRPGQCWNRWSQRMWIGWCDRGV